MAPVFTDHYEAGTRRTGPTDLPEPFHTVGLCVVDVVDVPWYCRGTVSLIRLRGVLFDTCLILIDHVKVHACACTRDFTTELYSEPPPPPPTTPTTKTHTHTYTTHTHTKGRNKNASGGGGGGDLHRPVSNGYRLTSGRINRKKKKKKETKKETKN